MEEVEPAFGHWLAGFADGEGCFVLRTACPTGRIVRTWTCEFTIQLRIDDTEVLQEVQRRTGLGRLSIEHPSRYRANPMVRWTVSRKSEAALLVKLFEQYPLRAKKRRDFAIWRQAVAIWLAMHGRHNDWTQIADLAATLRETRRFDNVPEAAIA